jgi:hypothetical protein
MAPSSRLLIVDQSLRDMAGHHYEYDVALFRAAAAAGVPALIGAHTSVQPLPLLGKSVRGWFQRAWYDVQGDQPAAAARAASTHRVSTRLGRWFRRAIGRKQPPELGGIGAEVLELVRSERFGTGDHVLVHTFNIPELDSLIEMARSHKRLPLIHIVFRRDAEEPAVAGGPNGGIRGSLARLMSSKAAMATVRLYADTNDLARQYSDLVPGLAVGTLPIPHCLPSAVAKPSRGAEPLRIVYLGDARDEKGFHLLPDVVDALADRLFPINRARFLIQGNVSIAGKTPAIAAARQRLAAYPSSQVELLLEQLEISAFHDLLQSADIVVLPYEPRAYARRSSGILVQALAAGRVVVVPAQTWMATQVDPAASVLFEDESSLATAVMSAVERWPVLSKHAEDNAPSWQARHDPSLFISQLLHSHDPRRSGHRRVPPTVPQAGPRCAMPE